MASSVSSVGHMKQCRSISQPRLKASNLRAAPFGNSRNILMAQWNHARTSPRYAGRLAASKEVQTTAPLSGVVFQPMEEAQMELGTIDGLLTKRNDPRTSFARTAYEDTAEAAINEQINVEFSVFYAYQALWSFFDRDVVGLPGFAAYFRSAGQEELTHAQRLMQYQGTRGGRVRLAPLLAADVEGVLANSELGDAAAAAELALSLEKLNFQKLRQLHDVAVNNNDANMADFIESYLLEDQVADVKKSATLLAQLLRVGKGHGVYHVDRELLRQYGDYTSNPFSNGAGNGAEADGGGGNGNGITAV